MTKKILKKIITICQFGWLLILDLPLKVAAGFPAGDKIKNSLIQTGKNAGFVTDPTKEPDFIKIIGKYVNGLLELMGVLFLVLTIYGGFMWMTAAGNEDRVLRAKKVLIGAAIGIAIVLLSLVITNFALKIFEPAVLPS